MIQEGDTGDPGQGVRETSQEGDAGIGHAAPEKGEIKGEEEPKTRVARIKQKSLN